MRTHRLILASAAAAALAGVAPSAHAGSYPLTSTPYELHVDTPESADMHAGVLEDAVDEVQEAVDLGHIKGAVLLAARRGKIVLHAAVGVRDGLNSQDPSMYSPPMPLDAIFDLESMTKPFTVFLAMKMQESGDFPGFSINDTVGEYFSEFAVAGKSTVTVRDLMAYVSGEPLDGEVDFNDPWHSMLDAPLSHPPGTQVLYSDLGYRILGHVLETVGGASLQDLMKTYIFDPLGMTDTGFQPWINMPEKQDRFAGTAWSATRGRYLRGEVQDETDFALGGGGPLPGAHLTGCDGLFSTALDLAKFAQMLLNRGKHAYQCNPAAPSLPLCTTTLLSAQAVLDMTTVQTATLGLGVPASTFAENLFHSNKGFGWEMWDAGAWPGSEGTTSVAYSKTGGAGTLMVIDPDPDQEIFTILLTNHGLPAYDNFSQDPVTGRFSWEEFDWMIEDMHAVDVMLKVNGAILY